MRVRLSGRDQQELIDFVKELETLQNFEITYASELRDSTRTNNPKYQKSKEIMQYVDIKKKA
ncbi:DUF3970 family protein [Alkalihalophilus lindianensis]|uniref:DUF3970 family protein n=1 Tax=Alkalihalophilus lindianensis TaxID=1630542 RepID=A0ABU3X766_9BACI|nr:DUF3970 family protein [Alkalihalophilus lindianensis]MDV2683736.1 DUF3970 family protein [Alkalihalophilus lindianensis]